MVFGAEVACQKRKDAFQMIDPVLLFGEIANDLELEATPTLWQSA